MKNITIVFILKEKHKFNETKQYAQNAKILLYLLILKQIFTISRE